MKKDIVLRAPNEELTEDKINKIKVGIEEFNKSLRHETLFYQSLYIALIVLILSILLELMDLILDSYNISNLGKIITKLVLIGLLLFVTIIRYKEFFNLEGKSAFYITPEYLKYNKNKKNKIKK